MAEALGGARAALQPACAAAADSDGSAAALQLLLAVFRMQPALCEAAALAGAPEVGCPTWLGSEVRLRVCCLPSPACLSIAQREGTVRSRGTGSVYFLFWVVESNPT